MERDRYEIIGISLLMMGCLMDFSLSIDIFQYFVFIRHWPTP